MLCKALVSRFFKIVNSLRGSEFNSDYFKIAGDIKVSCEVFRYCLCSALNLQTTSNVRNLDEVQKYITNAMRVFIYDGVHLKPDLDEVYRQNILQTSVNFMVERCDRARGYFGESR